MLNNEKPEVWLRGPIPDVPDLLQPVAHALFQAREEIAALAPHFPSNLLWERPGGVASVGFHLQHLTGVLDRLFTYARQQSLNEVQLAYLQNEGKSPSPDCTFQDLVMRFDKQFELAMDQLKNADPMSLTEIRYVGRNRLPSTHLGLLFHVAEHAQRHVGQNLVTARLLLYSSASDLTLNSR